MSARENKRRRLSSPRRSAREGSMISNEPVAPSQSNMVLSRAPSDRQSLGVMMPSFEAVQDLGSRMDESDRLISEIQARLHEYREATDTDRDKTEKRLDTVQRAQNYIVRQMKDLEAQRQNPELTQLKPEVDLLKAHFEGLLAAAATEHKKHLAEVTGLLSAVLVSEPKPERSENSRSLKRDAVPKTLESSQDSGQSNQVLLLPLLHKMDFRDPGDLKALKKIENWQVALALFSDREKHVNEPVAYSIKANAPFADYLCPGARDNPNKVSSFWLYDQWKDWPTILELSNHRTESITKPAFPKYVWEVGEIYNRRIVRRTNQWTEQSTGYHLVVDVTSPSKALWMVYRHVEHGDANNVDRDVTRAKDAQWHPFVAATSDSVDAAQVFSEVGSWKGLNTPVGSFNTAVKLVKRTGRTMIPTPTFVEPVLEEVKREIAKGWGQT